MEWIFSKPKNLLFVVVNGKVVELKHTFYNHSNYQEYLEESNNNLLSHDADKPIEAKRNSGKLFIDGLRKISLDALRLAEIILNPNEGQIDFTEDDIKKHFDIDKLRIMAEEWMDRKILRPRLERENDPLLTLGEK